MSNEAGSLPVPKWLRNRFGVWLRRNGLADIWDVELSMWPTLDRGKVAARTQWPSGYGRATCAFSKANYDASTEKEMDLVINHEQYHLLIAREDDRLIDMIGFESAVYKAIAVEQERHADHFAMIMVRAYSRRRAG